MSACTLFSVLLLLSVRSVSVTAAVKRIWQLKTYWVHGYTLVKYTLYFLPGRTPRVGVVTLLTAQVKSTDLNSICLSCVVVVETKSRSHTVWHNKFPMTRKECVYMSSCFAITYIAYYVSLLLHVLKHRINKHAILQNIHFTANTTL